MKINHLAPFILFLFLLPLISSSQNTKDNNTEKANWRVDNNGYWKRMAQKGLTTLNPVVDVPAAKYTGSEIKARSVMIDDSPDVPVTTENSTQSENSIFINPADPQNILNSNNSTANPYPPLYGANDLYSFDGGLTWMGEIQGAGVDNSGDPAVVIGNNGWYYVNHITSSAYGQQLAYSTDQGASWNITIIDNGSGSYVLDKNHFWIDNTPASPYEGNLYCAWTDFGGSNDNDIELSYSSDGGLTFSSAVNISAAVNAMSHCQGVNINTGPNGEVYAVFAIYDGSDENAYGLAKSLDGGATWEPATRIIEDTRGIRSSGTSKNQRVNSFPVLAVDVSGGSYNGNLYMVWTNIGVPGVNTGNDIDVYMIRSEDQGDSWSNPIRVNQDDAGLGHEHYFPWITCDPVTGILSVVFYDDRNVGGADCEVYCANSFDAGNTWEDFKVSDVSFTPAPIPGLASGYMGDYLGISARDSYVYPCWTDNRTGTTMTYVSPYVLNTLSRPYDLTADLDEVTGDVDLDWRYDPAPGFQYFNVYRNDVLIAQPTDTTYADQLPDYGAYTYKVSAFYDPDGESIPAAASLQWGNPHILVTPDELEQTLPPDQTAMQYLYISNIGELDLTYDISTFIITDATENKSYCDASGGCDEFISIVEFGSIYKSSGCDGYADYTNLVEPLSPGQTIPISITNGNAWNGDVCGIWIDWNQNEDFTDDAPVSVSGGPEVFTASINVPTNAVGGTARMRIRIQYYGTPEPCGTTSYGEVEDYSINVNTWLSINQNLGILSPQDTDSIEVVFNSDGLDLGVYNAELSIASDDPDLPEVIAPVTLTVNEFSVNASASANGICLGDSVQLDVDVQGGSGSYTYNWTSDPPGFSSGLKDPVASPLVNTRYMVEASDATHSSTDDVDVSVYDLPAVTLGPDTTICEGDSITFDPGSGFASYLWQDGSEEETFTATESGIYWVEVSNNYSCKNRDSVMLSLRPFALQPDMPSGTATIDLYNGNTYTYTTNAVTGATDYTWELQPDTIAFITNNGDEAIIELDTSYTGQARLKVMAENSCGSSMWSDSLGITILNTTRINEFEKELGMKIYPNPNTGMFTIEFITNRAINVNIYILDKLGKAVYNKESLRLNGKHSENINLGDQVSGIYTVIIESNNTRISKQIILRP